MTKLEQIKGTVEAIKHFEQTLYTKDISHLLKIIEAADEMNKTSIYDVERIYKAKEKFERVRDE